MKKLVYLMLPAVMLFASCDDKKEDKKEGDDKKKDGETTQDESSESFKFTVCDCVALGEEISAKYNSGAEDFAEFEKSKAGDLQECERLKNSKGNDAFSQEAIACMQAMQQDADEQPMEE
jgi:hypothetical protein